MNFFVRPKTAVRSKILCPVEDVVRYERKDKLVKVNVDEKGNVDEDDFIVQETVVEVERVDRDEYINSFSDDVGIANILKKVALSGDVSLLNQIQRNKLPTAEDGKEMIQDITPLQEGEEAIAKMGDSMRNTYAKLPDELKAGRTLEQFLEGVSQAEIDAFVNSYIESKKGDAK